MLSIMISSKSERKVHSISTIIGIDVMVSAVLNYVGLWIFEIALISALCGLHRKRLHFAPCKFK